MRAGTLPKATGESAVLGQLFARTIAKARDGSPKRFDSVLIEHLAAAAATRVPDFGRILHRIMLTIVIYVLA